MSVCVCVRVLLSLLSPLKCDLRTVVMLGITTVIAITCDNFNVCAQKSHLFVFMFIHHTCQYMHVRFTLPVIDKMCL